MKKSIQSFIHALKERSDGSLSGGFASIRGGQGDEVGINHSCDNGSCSGTNTIGCSNMTSCSGTTNNSSCSNVSACFV